LDFEISLNFGCWILNFLIKIAFFARSSYNRQVKHLIRNTKSLQFFDHGHWTTDARQAQAFETSEAARETSVRCGLNDAEFVLDPSQIVEASSSAPTITLTN
jgi:hypothetical protein